MTKPTPEEIIAVERSAIADKLEFIDNQVKDHATTPLGPDIVENYYKECNHWVKRLDELHHSIRTLNPADLDDHKVDYFALLASVRQVQTGLSTIKATFPTPTASSSAATSTGSGNPNMRLPKLELQPFHGEFLEWTSFKDTFEAAVHNNKELSKVQKFAYLKSLLKDEPARSTADLALTDGNYDLAWTQLQERYDNPRKITMSIMDRYVSLPKTNRTAKSIKELIDGTNRCIRSLEQHGIKHYELFYVHTIISKLDSQAKDLFEHTLKNKQIPVLSKLLEFLERHATALEEDSDRRVTEKKHGVHFTQGHKSCPLGCTDNHPVYKCKRFISLNIPQRWEIVKSNKLCCNCLINHPNSECRSQHRCRHCNELHSNMLHNSNQ
jgi:hypothetical protein